MLSAVAEREGCTRKLLILKAQSLKRTMAFVADFQPRIIAYSAMTFEHRQVIAFNSSLKNNGLNFLSIFGGHHFIFNPEEISRNSGIDAVCTGEGEIVFSEFIRAVKNGTDFSGITGLWSRISDTIKKNPRRQLITDLDTLPFPDRNLFPVHNSPARSLYGGSAWILFGRGCPNKCAYCFNVRFNQLFPHSRPARFRTVDNVIAEIKHIQQLRPLKMIIFGDDCFSYLPCEILDEFADKYPKEIALPFFAQFRPEMVTELLIRKLKHAGLFLAAVGVECGNENISAEVLHRGKAAKNIIINAFQILHRHGVRTWSMNLMGLPVKNPLGIDMETIRLNIILKPYYANFNLLVPIPQTPIWDYCTQNGYISPDKFLNYSQPPSNLTRSILTFNPPALNRSINNLHKFAALIIRFPFLFPIARVLIRLPENIVFTYIYLAWYGYRKTIASFNVKINPSLIFTGLRTIRGFLRHDK